MAIWRQKLCRHFKAITGFLIVVELMLMLLPAHYHVHHNFANGASEHNHVVDLHVITNSPDHSHSDNTQLLSSAPDGLLKYLDSNVLPILFIALFLSLMPIAVFSYAAQNFRNILFLAQHFYYRSPPLRGPPLLG